MESALERLRKKAGEDANRQIDELSKSVTKLSEYSQSLLKQMHAVMKEADEERQKFVYLAGIGLMTEFIFHELERAVSYTLRVIEKGAFQQTTIHSLQDQLKTLHKRIASL